MEYIAQTFDSLPQGHYRIRFSATKPEMVEKQIIILQHPSGNPSWVSAESNDLNPTVEICAVLDTRIGKIEAIIERTWKGDMGSSSLTVEPI